MIFNYSKIWEILLYSFKEGFKWSPIKWFLSIGLGILAGIILPIGKGLFEWDEIIVAISTAVILFLLFLVRFLLLFIKESLKYYHEVYQNATYGEAIILLKDSFAEAHYYRKNGEFNNQEFMSSMIIFCNNLKKIFDKITKSECSVSIKVPISDDSVSEGTILKNLTRDHEHQHRDTSKYSEINHTIIGNSAFNNCLNKVITDYSEKYYINNDVNNSTNYLNTSKACYKDELLPYNSELVTPIVPIKTQSTSTYQCHGFICVDSKKLNAFDLKYSPALLEGVADGIYDLIQDLNTRNNAKN